MVQRSRLGGLRLSEWHDSDAVALRSRDVRPAATRAVMPAVVGGAPATGPMTRPKPLVEPSRKRKISPGRSSSARD